MKADDLDRVLKLVNGNGLVLLVSIGVKAADAQVEAGHSPIAGPIRGVRVEIHIRLEEGPGVNFRRATSTTAMIF